MWSADSPGTGNLCRVESSCFDLRRHRQRNGVITRHQVSWTVGRELFINLVPSLLIKEMTMKLMHMFSVGVTIVGMTCLVGYASAATPGDPTMDSMLVAQGTAAPGGTGSGSSSGMGSGNTGAGMPSGSTDPGKGTGGTFPEKARPGIGMNTGPAGNSDSIVGGLERVPGVLALPPARRAGAAPRE